MYNHTYILKLIISMTKSSLKKVNSALKHIYYFEKIFHNDFIKFLLCVPTCFLWEFFRLLFKKPFLRVDNHISLRLYNSKLLRPLFLGEKKIGVHTYTFTFSGEPTIPWGLFMKPKAKDSQSKRRSTFKLLTVPLAQTFRRPYTL